MQQKEPSETSTRSRSTQMRFMDQTLTKTPTLKEASFFHSWNASKQVNDKQERPRLCRGLFCLWMVGEPISAVHVSSFGPSVPVPCKGHRKSVHAQCSLQADPEYSLRNKADCSGPGRARH